MISGLSIACAVMTLKAMLDYRKSIDIVWTLPSAPFFSLVEICVALVTSSVPVIYSLLVKSRASSKHSRGSTNPKPSNSQLETRWHNQNVSASGTPSPKTHGDWKLGRSKGLGKEAEMDVFKTGTLNTFHEIPSTTNLHESEPSARKSHDAIEVK